MSATILDHHLAAELVGKLRDGRTEPYRPGPDAMLNDPADVAAAVLFALRQPAGCAVREVVICPAEESSYP